MILAKLIVFILALATITVAQQPKTVEGYVQTGTASQRAGKHQEAIQDFAAALKLEPGNFAAQYGSGLSYMFLEKWEDAVASFKAALILKPDELFVQLALAGAPLAPASIDVANPDGLEFPLLEALGISAIAELNTAW